MQKVIQQLPLAYNVTYMKGKSTDSIKKDFPWYEDGPSFVVVVPENFIDWETALREGISEAGADKQFEKVVEQTDLLGKMFSGEIPMHGFYIVDGDSKFVLFLDRLSDLSPMHPHNSGQD